MALYARAAEVSLFGEEPVLEFQRPYTAEELAGALRLSDGRREKMDSLIEELNHGDIISFKVTDRGTVFHFPFALAAPGGRTSVRLIYLGAKEELNTQKECTFVPLLVTGSIADPVMFYSQVNVSYVELSPAAHAARAECAERIECAECADHTECAGRLVYCPRGARQFADSSPLFLAQVSPGFSAVYTKQKVRKFLPHLGPLPWTVLCASTPPELIRKAAAAFC